MKGILSLYWSSLTRLKTSSWGKNSIFMILGIIIAVGALTLSMILFESYEETLSSVLKTSQPDLTIVNNRKELSTQQQISLDNILSSFESEIKAVSVQSQASVIIKYKDKNRPAYLESFSNENYQYNQYLYAFAKSKNYKLEDNEIILGTYLAKDLRVDVGDYVEVILPSSIRYSIFGLIKKTARFIVKDVYKTGLYEIDANRGFVNAQKIKSLNGGNNGNNYSLLLNQRDNDTSAKITSKLNYRFMNELPSMYAKDMFYNNSAIFSALSLQKLMIFIILCIIVIVASFNVISTVSTIINEKINEIGILMTLGLKRSQIKLIYYTFSLALAHIGIILGLISGYGLAYWLTHQDYFSLKGDIYFIDKIMINPSFAMLVAIYSTAVVIISVTILLSLRTINKLQIIKIMRQ